MPFGQEKYTSQLLTAATAANSPPTAATDGISLNDLKYADEAVILVVSTAGSGAMDVTVRMWGYESTSAEWSPLGIGGDATKGFLNGGVAMGETTSDQIAHSEIIVGLSGLDRLYAEITAINGTSTAVSSWVSARP